MELSESLVENIGDAEDTFTDIRKRLLDDFETAETVRKVIKGSKNGDSREPIKVYLRLKPLTSQELEAGEGQDCLKIENLRTVCLHPPKTSFTFKHQTRNAITAETIQRFTFTRVFDAQTRQRKFFEETCLEVVKDFINGQNCLVFSYGITNAGKTYTILGDPQNAGILPRTIKILFNSFKNQNYESSNLKPKMFCDVVKLSSIQEESEESKKKNLLMLNDIHTYHQSISSSDLSVQDNSQDQQSQEDLIDVSSLLDVTSVDVDDQGPVKFSLWISFAEIYNEYIYDLLEPISMNKETRRRTALRVGDDRGGNAYVKGLTEIHVNNADEACKLLKIGRKNQKIASTKLNQNSSRSHCIFTLKILRVVDVKEPHVARVSRLSFIDLAGSERYTKTQNTGARLKEAGNINTSIMTLGKCVELLRYNQNHVNNPKNIPFRESKLTRLFQGFFCGKGKASMIVNVSQCASAFDETLHALKFSAIAKKVTTITHGPQVAPKPKLQPPARVTRASVVWADGSINTPVGNKAKMPSDEAEDDATEILTPIFNNHEDYQKIIEELQAKLIDERKQKAYMEMRIREEVSKEMAQQIVEIEKEYNERLEEEQRATEELYEKRVDILCRSVKKTRKRARIERSEGGDDDRDDDIASVVSRRYKSRIEELNKHICNLEEQLKNPECQSLRKKVNFQNERIEELETSLQDAKVELQTKESEIVSLSGSLSQLKSTQTNECQALRSELKSRDERVEELEKSLKDFQARLEEKECEIATISGQVEASQNEKFLSLKNELKSRDGRVEELEKSLQDFQIRLEVEAKQNEECQNLRNDLKSRDGRIEELEKSLKDFQVRLEAKECEIATINRRVEARQDEECQTLTSELKSRDERVEELERVLKDCKVELEEKNTQLMAVKKVQDSPRSSTPTKSAQNRLMKQLERRLQDSTAALDKKNSQLIGKNTAIAKLESNVKDLRNELTSKDAELTEFKAKYVQIEKELSSRLQEHNSDLMNKTKEKEEVEENLRFVEGELQILSCKEQETQEEIRGLTKQRDDMEDEAQKWKIEAENLEKAQEKLKEDLEAQAQLFEEHKRETQSLKQIIEKNKAEVAELKYARQELKQNFDMELKKAVEAKEGDMRHCEDLHKQQVADLNSANQELQQSFEKALQDLANVQARVTERNQKLDHLETVDLSLKDAYRSKEAEVVQLRKELQANHEEHRNALQEKDNVVAELEKRIEDAKQKMEREKLDEIVRGLEEQDELLAQMEKDMASKEEEIASLSSQVEKLLRDSERVKELTKENEDIHEQCERLKIKIFELETEVEKLQQDVKKETRKKDSATQALKDGLEIVKAKKLEYETKLNDVDRQNEEIRSGYETRVAALQQELERLKSASSDEPDEQTDSSEKENGNCSNSDSCHVYKPVKVESFNLQEKDRVEIDVTPITGSGLRKAGKKTGSAKAKSTLKRKSSDLTLKEIQQMCSGKKEKKGHPSDDEFTPVSQTKLRKTRSSVVGRTTRQSKANMTASTMSLTTLDEDSENSNPKAKSARKFLNKLAFPDAILKHHSAEPKTKSKRRKLFKKSEISAPFSESPVPLQYDQEDSSSTKAQEVIMRRLRARDVKITR